jgi:hypothetical protein
VKKGYAFRIIVITIAFVLLGVSILIPLGKAPDSKVWLFVMGGILLAAYIGAIVWSLVYYARHKK